MITIKNEKGGVLGTRILDEDGTDLTSKIAVSGLVIDMSSVNMVATAHIQVGVIETEIELGKVNWITKHPVSGKFEPIKSILFQDDTVISFDEYGTPVVKPPGSLTSLQMINDGRMYKFKAPPPK